MPYKPKYCCQCGEKIDRIDWKPWNSRRFCELCATDFIVYDWLVRALFGIGLLLGLFGIGSIFQTAEKQLNFAPNQLASLSASNNKSEVSNQKSDVQVSTDTGVPPPVQTNNFNSQTKLQVAPLPADLKNKSVETAPNGSSEASYFCGAQTKKGTLCSRRVRGGGRCWQHTGQTAMLPQAKLIVNQ